MRSLRLVSLAVFPLCASPLQAQTLGSFAGTLGAAVPGPAAGSALVCVSDDDPREVTTFIVMRDGAGREVGVTFPTPAPQPGVYDLDARRPGNTQGARAWLTLPAGAGRVKAFSAREGTVRLATAPADHIQGVIAFRAETFSPPMEESLVELRFTARRVGAMTEGRCVDTGGAVPAASASGALAGAAVPPGTAALALRSTAGTVRNTAQGVDFCPIEEGLDVSMQVQGGGTLLMSRIPPRPGSFTVGLEDNEVFVVLYAGSSPLRWSGESGFVRITSVLPGRLQGSLDVRISPIGSSDGSYIELAGAFDALLNPRCTSQ